MLIFECGDFTIDSEFNKESRTTPSNLFLLDKIQSDDMSTNPTVLPLQSPWLLRKWHQSMSSFKVLISNDICLIRKPLWPCIFLKIKKTI